MKILKKMKNVGNCYMLSNAPFCLLFYVVNFSMFSIGSQKILKLENSGKSKKFQKTLKNFKNHQNFEINIKSLKNH